MSDIENKYPLLPIKWGYMSDESWVDDNLFPIWQDADDDPEEFIEYAYANMFAYYFAIDRKYNGKWIATYTVCDDTSAPDIASKEFDLRAEAFSFIEKMWADIWEKMTS